MTSKTMNLVLLLLELKEDYACSHSITQGPSSMLLLLKTTLLERKPWV